MKEKRISIFFCFFKTLIVGINLPESDLLSLQTASSNSLRPLETKLQYENHYTGTLPSSWSILTNLNSIEIVTYFCFFGIKHSLQ